MTTQDTAAQGDRRRPLPGSVSDLGPLAARHALVPGDSRLFAGAAGVIGYEGSGHDVWSVSVTVAHPLSGPALRLTADLLQAFGSRTGAAVGLARQLHEARPPIAR
jgi:hypothetical protein